MAAAIVPSVSPPSASARPSTAASPTGFAVPFTGAPAYEHLGPNKISAPGQLNQPLGIKAADALALKLGITRADALSERQSRLLMTGGGIGGDRAAAKTIDASIRILINSVDYPMYSKIDGAVVPSVLGSYGVYVTTDGLLQSPANASAPTRQVNTLIAPGGYVGTWMRNNGAARTMAALYRSPYTIEAVYGYAAQQMSGAAQLVTNTKGGVTTQVGMSMAPPLWIVNFLLIYVVKPELAAAMPAAWAPIPEPVARAIEASPTGQVAYTQYASYFE